MPSDIAVGAVTNPWRHPPPSNIDMLIAAVSWEPRFVLGLERMLETTNIGELLLLHFKEHAVDTTGPMQRATRLARKHGVAIEVCTLSYLRPEETWKDLRKAVASRSNRVTQPLVDISTMPRDTTWTVLHFLDYYIGRADYAYHSPGAYTQRWLSQDPEPPRLVLQLSGRAKLGCGTALFVTAGFDGDRTIQLVRAFDPVATIVGLQVGDQFGNEKQKARNKQELSEEFGGSKLELFDLDAFGSDHGRAEVARRLIPYLEAHNIVMASLGPKLSAIPLYQIHRKHPETALAYSPAKMFNKQYSRGIGVSYTGRVFDSPDNQ